MQEMVTVRLHSTLRELTLRFAEVLGYDRELYSKALDILEELLRHFFEVLFDYLERELGVELKPPCREIVITCRRSWRVSPGPLPIFFACFSAHGVIADNKLYITTSSNVVSYLP